MYLLYFIFEKLRASKAASKPASQQSQQASQLASQQSKSALSYSPEPSTIGASRNSKICIFRNDGEEKYQDLLLILIVIAIWCNHTRRPAPLGPAVVIDYTRLQLQSIKVTNLSISPLHQSEK